MYCILETNNKIIKKKKDKDSQKRSKKAAET